MPLNNISPFHYFTQKVLPTIFDDALSYAEVMGKIVVKLNEIIDSTNAQNDYIQEKFNEINAGITEWETDFTQRTEQEWQDWLTETLETLEQWKDGFEDQFAALVDEIEQITVDAVAAKEAAETAATNAGSSATAAAGSAADAASSAASIASDAEQILKNESNIADLKNELIQVSTTGIHTVYSDYIVMNRGQIRSDGSISTVTNKHMYVIWSTIPDYGFYVFDDSIYKMNFVGYDTNDDVVIYPAWITMSPAKMYKSYPKLGVNVTRIDGANLSDEELTSALKLMKNIDNLATTNQLIEKTQKSKKLKCIYPDDFTSRIKPNIYFDGGFYADIDTEDYKINGYDERWIASDGSDSNQGLEDSPFLTIDKAIAVGATTIHLKEGTYNQGTNYSTTIDIGGKNLIGHGSVILQHDNSDHYVKATGTCYVENVHFVYGNTGLTNTSLVTYANGNGQTACFVECEFEGGQNSIAVRGIDAVMIRCLAHGANLDGFNYHARTLNDVTYIPNVIEIDCKGYDNGSSSSGSDSCNGSTAHDGSRIIRLNGEYYNCYGGVIAEIGVLNETTTMSVNYGVLSRDSIGTGTYKASYWAGRNTKMWLYDCKSSGGDYDLSAVYDALIVSRRLTTGRDIPSVNEADTATVLQY